MTYWRETAGNGGARKRTAAGDHRVRNTRGARRRRAERGGMRGPAVTTRVGETAGAAKWRAA
ncbi:hypothetical protein Raf01_64640 [Rugosimonospora africana]|uniref:Uncharacterized protein n=1 Tax=Rugosimonospora africana TaxID=556532 RepID=A0A8J3QY63_9ACTN|nr:hypothetical protein Raf01_64640 [Rugosimonospora africana]